MSQAPPTASPRSATAELSVLATKRLAIERVILAIVLPAVAGNVNGIAFRVLGSYVSHVTGHSTRFGLAAAEGDWLDAHHAAFLVGLYFCGAFLATCMISYASHLMRARYMAVLLTELVCLVTFGWLTAHGSTLATPLDLAGLLALAMGLQNAMVTQISGAVVRTTHVTGLVTDAAAELALVLISLRQSLFGGAPPFKLAAHPAWPKLRLHVCIIASFVAGATSGCWLHMSYDDLALAAPCLVLLALALFDSMLGIRGVRPRRRATTDRRRP